MSGNTVSELLEQALKVNGDKNAVLLLDMRPAVCKVVSSIKTAVGVSVSNMLLRRPMYSLDMLTEQLTTQREIQAFSNWRQFANIVLFDATGTVPAKGTPMFCIAQKLRKEGYSARLGYIRGGYNAFAHEHASLCSVPKTTSPFRSRLHLGSLPKMMIKPTESGSTVCETPMMENPNVNPLFESVRQAMGLNTNITEEVPVRFPPDFSLNSIRDRLPVWLLNAIDIRSGKKVLAEYFQKVEIGEKKRLALLTAPQEMRSNRTTDLSICAGLEKGLKNRYNHVWPFDHTRVRIKECENGEDDYINASFLEPPFGQKRYIGAQAPLPSTFQDFWKVIWEQESWVIVMLTREFEAGRVKCHKYWPTSEQPVMELGPLRVTFLSEYRVEPDNDSILVRHMQLRHLHRSEDSVRVITQIQYTGWPDFGVPDTPMDVLKVIQLANDHGVPASAGPMMVHCSAGCGRTGAFCVIDSVLADLKTHPETVMGETDVIFASVNRLREQRLSMVQCLRQFVFCYEAILWRLAVPLTRNNNRLQLSLPRKGLVPQTPSLSFPRRISITQPALSRGIAPATTTNKEFSFFA
ncbi:protein-tyrosine phosphatase-like protein [Gamsiella multidivaricata]|uniref:protein-tyrosine phosphatase-like protein n=1 Tax=Gamsiella multidivaricata TaxID=101098 RepID=UPI002220BA1B|nr:protein-tyrosine phosphatase-like protein [Gamsiella multidivaricata]KAI7821367.1 protein-tyrosine phosphatase-like protein [Gamsiella multidivaricata]